MVSLALKFGQLIHPSLGMKISTVKHLDTVQCFHPFTDELKVNGKAKGLEFYLRFFLFGCKTTGLSFEASMNQEKALETIYTKRIQELFCCYLDTLLKTE